MKHPLPAVAVVSFALLGGGCGGTSNPGAAGGRGADGAHREFVHFAIHLQKPEPVIKPLAAGAQQAGCTIGRLEDDKVVADCAEGRIAVIQEGTEVTVACKEVTEPTCQRIFKEILAHTPVAK